MAECVNTGLYYFPKQFTAKVKYKWVFIKTIKATKERGAKNEF